jgi:hypothetical protein
MDYIMKSPEAGVDMLNIQFAVGATGAVGAIQGPGGSRMKEFRRISAANPSPVVRTGVGTYDVFLREAWLALIDYDADTIGPVSPTTGREGKLVTNNVTSASAPKVTITYLRDDTGAAADPSNGDIAVITLYLKKFKPV